MNGVVVVRRYFTFTMRMTKPGTYWEGELTFRYVDRTETVGAGRTVFVPAGVAHTYTSRPGARYLIVLTPRLSELIATLQSDRDPAHQREIYQRFDSELLE